MKISTQLIGKVLYYETEYFDGKNWYSVCNFGKVDNITISVSSTDQEPEFLTIKENNGRTHNFCTPKKKKVNKYIAQDISILKLASN